MLRYYRRADAWLKLRRRVIFRWAHIIVPLVFLALAVGIRLRPGGLSAEVKNRVFDQFQRARPRPYEPVPVRIVDIDDKSLSKLGQWPWPRTLLAQLIERLSDEGAAVIAFDALFSEPDRTSPAQVVASWPDSPDARAMKAKVLAMPDHDKVFAKAIAGASVVAGFALTGEANSAVPAAKATFAYAGDGPLAFVANFPGAVVNLPVIEKAAAGNGSIGFIPEPDGIIRRAPLILGRGQALLPSLAAEALRVAQGAKTYAIKTSGASGESGFGQHTGIVMVKIGQFKIPTDADGRVWVYFTGRTPERTVPAWCVFDERCAGDKLKDSIVFVGTSASGLKDLRATPLNPAAPGVEVHANVVEDAMLGSFLHRPDYAEGAEVIYMLVLGLILLFLLPRLGAAWCALVAIAGIGGAFWFSWQMFTRQQYLFDPVFPGITVLFVYMSSSLISYLKSEAERKQVKGAFSRYMSPALVDQLARHPEKLQLGGEMRVMTFHFCDIRGFTTISEQFDPHGLTQFINRFLTPMTEIILQHQGVIDKYMGDCIMAFWNAPLDDPDHARHACQAALKMHARLEQLNKDLKVEADAAGRKFIPIHIGTGLNTGGCVVGNMGSEQRFDYSVLGDDVNLASRLEGQSKTYGVNVIIGPKTRELAPEFASLELDLIKVKGKTIPVHIYTLLGDQGVKDSSDFKELAARHEEMLTAFRGRDWNEAEKLIEICRNFPFNLKVLYDRYVNDYIAFYRDHPPPSDWDGSFTATSK